MEAVDSRSVERYNVKGKREHMSKGFTIDKDLRDGRDGVCVDYSTTMEWAITNRPGAVPIGGGRKRRYAAFAHVAYRRYGKRNKLGRFTPPRGGAFPNPGLCAVQVQRAEAAAKVRELLGQ
jgi:hypothetical protein